MSLANFLDLTCEILASATTTDAMGGTVRDPRTVIATGIPFAYQPRSGNTGRGGEDLHGERIDGVAYFASDPGLAGAGRVIRFTDRLGRVRALEVVSVRDIATRGQLLTVSVREITPVPA